MLTDAHCHPFDLFNTLQKTENKNIHLLENTLPDKNILAIGNACDMTDLSFNEKLSRNDILKEKLTLLSSFGIHPQIFKMLNDKLRAFSDYQEINFDEQLETLDKLASEKRIIAIGECGFDLFNASFKETETIQERYFSAQIEIALRYDLPLVLHIRRAIHKIFAFTKTLSKCKAVIFHSWSGTLDEGLSLLRRKVNTYFSFGNTILLNHKQAINSCAHLPQERLLTETDAPYQRRQGEFCSSWRDLLFILDTIAKLRGGLTALEAENILEENFMKGFLF
ncbi:MAG: TatD family hydrolase [Treponema sp.]|nr:TatD family hydrolase [Treponema sp.]MCL2251700.1 TatD family hydrolase [Treponema sp.]